MDDICTLAAAVADVAVPNNTTLTTTGPNKAPILFTLPAKFKRFDPVSGGPKATTNGLAAVCCKEKPIAIIKKENKIKPNEPESTAGTIPKAPRAETPRPKTIPFL